MVFKLVQPTGLLLLPGKFLPRFQYSGEWERDFAAKTVRIAKKERSRIHLLTDADGNNYGFVAISFEILNNRCSLVINYLFTSSQYRGKYFTDLHGKVSDMLINFVVQTAIEINQTAPVKYISLQPADTKLISFYTKIGFKKLDDTRWMFMSVPETL